MNKQKHIQKVVNCLTDVKDEAVASIEMPDDFDFGVMREPSEYDTVDVRFDYTEALYHLAKACSKNTKVTQKQLKDLKKELVEAYEAKNEAGEIWAFFTDAGLGGCRTYDGEIDPRTTKEEEICQKVSKAEEELTQLTRQLLNDLEG